jgi:hypothetical protein
MKPSRLLALPLAMLFLACSDPESAGGTSTETENSVACRSIPVDSVLDSSERLGWNPAVATLRFDASNFDFSRSADSGLGLAVVGSDSTTPIPFEVVFWDSLSGRGRIHVRIEGGLLLPRRRFLLRWGRSRLRLSDSAEVWAGVTDSQRTASTSTLVDDFEGGSLLRNRLPDASFWYLGGSLTGSGLDSASPGRGGTTLRLACATGQCDTGRTLLAATLLAGSPRCLRSLDSVVVWARGGGKLWISMEHLDSTQVRYANTGKLDSLHPSRAWANRAIDSGWSRIAFRPSDFDAADGVSGNVGWAGVRDSINYITFLLEGADQLRLDDIRLHGIVPADLR